MGRDRRFGGYRGVILAAGLIILLAGAVLGGLLYLQKPQLTGNAGYQKPDAGYYPGGSPCHPSSIYTLPLAKRLDRTEECREAREQHRLNSNDLIQQQRSADASEAVARFAYYQAMLGVGGFIVGMGTLFAAGLAAHYARAAAMAARDAARSTEGSLGTAAESLKLARAIGVKQTRPYLVYDTAKRETVDDEAAGARLFSFLVTFRNGGTSPGLIYSYSVAFYVPSGVDGNEMIRGYKTKEHTIVGPTQTRQLELQAEFPLGAELPSYVAAAIRLYYHSLDEIFFEDDTYIIRDSKGVRQCRPQRGWKILRPEHWGEQN